MGVAHSCNCPVNARAPSLIIAAPHRKSECGARDNYRHHAGGQIQRAVAQNAAVIQFSSNYRGVDFIEVFLACQIPSELHVSPLSLSLSLKSYNKKLYI